MLIAQLSLTAKDWTHGDVCYNKYMNKKAIIPSIIGVLAFTGVVAVAYWESTQQMSTNEETQQVAVVQDNETPEKVEANDTNFEKNNAPTQEKPKVSNPPETKAEPQKKQAGAYVTYSSAAVASTKGTKLIFFHAPWCSQCRMIEGDITSQGVPDGVTVLKVDYDSNQELRKKYGVTLQTTFVRVNDDGSLSKKYVAYNEPTFDSVKRNLL